MKIVIAPDKFKNSLTGLEFCDAVAEGIRAIKPDADIIKLPLADGGDGTIEIMNYYLEGHFINVTVNDPFFRPIQASYLYTPATKTAFIEMAEASGVKLLKPEELDCKNATTLGTGEMIVDAIKKGAKYIILGIGGSATNDCGIGMATALGYRFFNKTNTKVKPIGANLSEIKMIDVSEVHSKLKEIEFKVACDVTNFLYGKNGAAHIYAKQKGATQSDIEMLDKGLSDFSAVLNSTFDINAQSIKGAGAAGGMGIASNVFLNGALKPGIKLIMELADFDNKIKDADWIITGEGKLDTQTLSGKTIKGVLDSAETKSIKVAAFCGGIDLEGKTPEALGFHYTDAVMNYTEDIEDAMENGDVYVRKIAKQFAKQI